jgi:hypothetical protein
MLYNPSWKTPKTDDVHSLDSLIAWLETKDPDQSYDYFSGVTCLCAQYYRAKGYWFVLAFNIYFSHGLGNATLLPRGFDFIASVQPHTFGSALKRARAKQETEMIQPAPTVYRTVSA